MLGLKRHTIGYVVFPGCRPADIIGTQSILGPHPLDRNLYVGPSTEPIEGRTGLSIVPNVDFEKCPQLDVLVVGDLPDEALSDNAFISFLADQIPAAKFVIGVSKGVMALTQTGLLKGRKVTSSANCLKALEHKGLDTSADRRPVMDGKFVTAGPTTGMLEAAFMVQEKLRGKSFTKYLEHNLEYDPVIQFPLPSTTNPRNVQTDSLEGLKIAVVVPSGIYVPDVVGFVDVMGLLPSTQFYYVSDTLDRSSCLLGPTLVPTHTYEDCPDVDIVIIGATHPRYMCDVRLLEFIRRQDKCTKAMVSVCAGSLVFGAAGVLDGKHATSNFHHTALLEKFGVTPSHAATEQDGKYYSAGPAIGSYEIALRVVAEVYGIDVAQHLEQNLMEYAPHPLFGVGSPQKASKLLHSVSKLILAPTIPIYSFIGKIGMKRMAQTNHS